MAYMYDIYYTVTHNSINATHFIHTVYSVIYILVLSNTV